MTAIWFHTHPDMGSYALTSPVFRYPFLGMLCFVLLNSFFLTKAERIVFLGFVSAGITMILLSLYSGELLVSAYDFGNRLGGTQWDSNEYAYTLLFAVFAAMFYHNNSLSLRTKAAFIGLIAVLTLFIVLSGSRTVLVGEAVFFLLMLGPGYIRDIIKKPRCIPKIVAVIILMCVASIYILNNTYIGQRFKRLAETEMEVGRNAPLETRLDGRVAFYFDAFELASKKPILGVGFDNFRYNTVYVGQYTAHSDYVAILTETGMPGFALYFSAYLVILLRLQRAIAVSGINTYERLCCRLLRNGLIVILLVAFFRWNHTHLSTYIFVALAGRYAAKVCRILPSTL
jgi:O-antigen ligase